jgi:hypothetical protein
MDNRDIVPYAPVPLLENGCHVNSELVNSVKACKYMYKYCYKGYDCANVEMQLNKENVAQNSAQQDSNSDQYDEIKQFLNCR